MLTCAGRLTEPAGATGDRAGRSRRERHELEAASSDGRGPEEGESTLEVEGNWIVD